MSQQPQNPPGAISPPSRSPNPLLTMPGFINGGGDDVIGGPQTPWWRRRWVIVVAIILVVLILGYLLINALTPKRTLAYQTGTVTRGTISQVISATGPVQSAASYNLSYTGNTTAKITEIDVKVGQAVKKGQTLAQVDKTALQNTLDKDQAKMSADQDSLNHALAALGLQQASNTASTNSSQTNLGNAQTTLGDSSAGSSNTLTGDQTKVNQDQTNLNNVQAAATTTVDQATITRDSSIATCNNDATASVNSQATATAAAKAATSAVETAQAAKATPTVLPIPSVSSGITVGGTTYSSLDQCIQAANDTFTSAVNTANTNITNANNTLANDQQALTSAQTQATTTAHTNTGQVNVSANSATAQTDTNNTNLETQRNNVVTAENTIKADQLVIQLDQFNVNQATLTAPHDGTVTAINGAVGGLPGQSSTSTSGASSSSSSSNIPFIQLVDLSTFQVQAAVNEADTANLQVGQPATFSVNAFPTKTFKGTVSSISPAGTTTNNVVTYPVAIDVDMNSLNGTRLLPSMTATVTITTLQRPDVLEIPVNAVNFARTASVSNATTGTNAIITRQQANTATRDAQQMVSDLEAQNPNITQDSPIAAYVIERPGGVGSTFIAKPVVLGLSDGQFYEVLGGLNEGESIITGTSTGGFGGAAGTRTPGGGGGGGGNGGGPGGGGG